MNIVVDQEIEYIKSQQQQLNFVVLSEDKNKIIITYENQQLAFTITNDGFQTETDFFETFESMLMNVFPSFQQHFMNEIMKKLK
ncbi:Aspartate/ornithine_carbamoyltransferase [Hexamita inflata]|uniref:Carbamoyl-P binding domain-containing protein n=1 Tax=Hexamita inflata TaxID=28002 RepID=A0AA86RAW4_9EUKA|nr:Aspartate/ornithine carbamoyltransferase [Hexamita inflata]